VVWYWVSAWDDRAAKNRGNAVWFLRSFLVHDRKREGTLSKGFRIVCENGARPGLGAAIAIMGTWARFSLRADRVASEGEGACLLFLKVRSHLPLRANRLCFTAYFAVNN
jgi:hypothetical protein